MYCITRRRFHFQALCIRCLQNIDIKWHKNNIIKYVPLLSLVANTVWGCVQAMLRSLRMHITTGHKTRYTTFLSASHSL